MATCATCAICLDELRANIVKLPDCAHEFHERCICELQTTQQCDQCPLCRRELHIETQYRCNVLNGSICHIEPFVLHGKQRTIAELRSEIDKVLPIRGGYEIQSFSTVITSTADLVKIMPFFEDGCFKNPLTIIHDGIQRYIRATQEIMMMPTIQYERVFVLRMHKPFLIGVHLPKEKPRHLMVDRSCRGAEVKFIQSPIEERSDTIKYAFIVEQNDAYLLLQMDPPFCMGEICRYGPTLPRRYYLFKDGYIFSMSTQFEIAQVQPDVIANADFKYEVLTYQRDSGDNVRIMKRATY